MILFNHCLNLKIFRSSFLIRYLNSTTAQTKTNEVQLLKNTYTRDDYTNPYHPLGLVRQRIINFFYKSFVNRRRNPVFSVHEGLPAIVSVCQNFDSLLIPKDHPSRSKSDCYYINRKYLLRAHMTAHQSELMQAGLNNFLMIGDVYRRDEIDRTHYPVFHQVDAVRLKTKEQIFLKDEGLHIFEEGNNTVFTGNQEKQACHSLEAVKLMEYELKDTLVGLAKHLFGDEIEYRWPSWELEVFYKNDWLELLGCGIMQQAILSNAGIRDRMGWAFGLGLERIAMCLYKIPDIRLFWSNDTGFVNQFKVDNVNESITYKSISRHPQCTNDISFWLPQDREFSSNDFYDLVRTIGGDLIEQVSLVDDFTHPKTGKTSHCYRIVYRHMDKTLTQEEVNSVHKEIENCVTELGVTLR
ncbi:hypothetical protein NQ317_013478 [Molorchus minor]|uniref:phenylalanine--tRNA ligase n=1 Tax=Molorchus minor TaxID=1323400 RepID=A0ABQ9JFS2_9CUCU|nr:hypothetical protein NQ317_013478 [Molorchus minor]